MRQATDTTAALRVGGLTRLTSIDFPGRLAAVVFCQGCPWRCGYCHNRGLLDGVVFSGGEPLAQSALQGALGQVRALGFATALHTGGMYPDRLAAALPLLDWVDLDIKALEPHYDTITRPTSSGARAWQSLRLLLQSGTPFECRTTWHPALFGEQPLRELALALAAQGVRRWALQHCRLPGQPAWEGDAAALLAGVRDRFETVHVRGN